MCSHQHQSQRLICKSNSVNQLRLLHTKNGRSLHLPSWAILSAISEFFSFSHRFYLLTFPWEICVGRSGLRRTFVGQKMISRLTGTALREKRYRYIQRLPFLCIPDPWFISVLETSRCSAGEDVLHNNSYVLQNLRIFPKHSEEGSQRKKKEPRCVFMQISLPYWLDLSSIIVWTFGFGFLHAWTSTFGAFSCFQLDLPAFVSLALIRSCLVVSLAFALFCSLSSALARLLSFSLALFCSLSSVLALFTFSLTLFCSLSSALAHIPWLHGLPDGLVCFDLCVGMLWEWSGRQESMGWSMGIDGNRWHFEIACNHL